RSTMVQAPSITTTVAEGLRGQYSNNDRTSRGGTRLLHCGIPVPSMTAMGQKQTSRRHLANLRFASESGHARVASRSPAQKLYILHKKLSLSGALCAKPGRLEKRTKSGHVGMSA